MADPRIGSAEHQLFRDLVEAVGEDFDKLASEKGEALVRQAAFDAPDPADVYPGLRKVASLTTMSMQEILNDPNVIAGFNYELKKLASEWQPIALRILGLE
jgi:hypothetical protein